MSGGNISVLKKARIAGKSAVSQGNFTNTFLIFLQKTPERHRFSLNRYYLLLKQSYDIHTNKYIMLIYWHEKLNT